MSENIEDQFTKFLAESKIDISGLEGTQEKAKLLADAKQQRNLAIVKAVSTEFIENPIKTHNFTKRRNSSNFSLIFNDNDYVEVGQLPVHKLRLVPPEIRCFGLYE